MGLFDSLTGREIFAPFDPFPAQKRSQLRSLSLSLAISADGTRIAVMNLAASEESGERTTHISIHDGVSGKELRRFEQFPGPVTQILLSADGSRLAVGFIQGESVNRSIQAQPKRQAGSQVWNTSTGELVQSLPLIPASLLSSKILWDPAGARLLRSSLSNDSDDNPSRLRQRFVLVDVTSGTELWEREFSDLAYPLTPWSWSPDGKLIAVAEHEPPTKPKVQLWDTPKERLELFIQVLHAVQHAHQKAIIHRDIKPSNVLVAEYDQQAVPKVIDFGVAKATSQKLTDKTMFTQFGQLVGTLEYMSPEQAKLNQRKHRSTPTR